jgi:hypothetical protein
MNREPTDQIWDLVQHFMMYDPITVLASVPNMREQFFKGRKLANNGCVHEIIGLSKFETGVTEVDNLRAALVRLLLQGLARNTMVENAVTLENAEANDALTGKLGGDDDGEDGPSVGDVNAAVDSKVSEAASPGSSTRPANSRIISHSSRGAASSFSPAGVVRQKKKD